MRAESVTCSAGKPRVRRRRRPLLQPAGPYMRVKLCVRCPYTPWNLADHYDPESEIHACAKCDGPQHASTNHYPREPRRRPKCATVPNIRGKSPPSVALSATESLVSSATTSGEPLSVQRSVLAASRPVRRAIDAGCFHFIPQPDNGCDKRHAASRFRTKEIAK
jgi:hypothetical protein